ncbi:hypothetical protein Pcac1_g5360 [Phytophthora cactorum]|nr:hypothetical protein Pcac1_g5360 [Phytophthora cactorum]
MLVLNRGSPVRGALTRTRRDPLEIGGIEAVPVVEVVALAPATVSRDVPGSGTRVVPG